MGLCGTAVLMESDPTSSSLASTCSTRGRLMRCASTGARYSFTCFLLQTTTPFDCAAPCLSIANGQTNAAWRGGRWGNSNLTIGSSNDRLATNHPHKHAHHHSQHPQHHQQQPQQEGEEEEEEEEEERGKASDLFFVLPDRAHAAALERSLSDAPLRHPGNGEGAEWWFKLHAAAVGAQHVRFIDGMVSGSQVDSDYLRRHGSTRPVFLAIDRECGTFPPSSCSHQEGDALVAANDGGTAAAAAAGEDDNDATRKRRLVDSAALHVATLLPTWTEARHRRLSCRRGKSQKRTNIGGAPEAKGSCLVFMCQHKRAGNTVETTLSKGSRLCELFSDPITTSQTTFALFVNHS